MINKKRRTAAVSYLVLALVAFVTLVPVVYCIMSSFKTNIEIMASPENLIPKEFTFQNYIDIFTSDSFDVLRMLWNSTYYTLFSVVINLVLSSVCGYVFARGNFPGKKAIFAVFASLMFINMGTITIYPKFQILSLVGLNRSLFGLMALKFFGIPIVNMYLVRGYIAALPKEMDEAARIDGCDYFRIFTKIIAPLLMPILATIGILSFQASWNEYLMPAVFTLTNPAQKTIMVALIDLKTSSEGATSWTLMLAASTVALLPILIVFVCCNKYFVQGLSEGAIKG